MVQDPAEFDVLVMPNLYGDILRLVCPPTSHPGLSGGIQMVMVMVCVSVICVPV